MKKAVLLAAVFGVIGLSSCCRIVDCCFEDPCAPAKYNPCEIFKKKDCGSCDYKPSCSKPCNSGCNTESKCTQETRCK